MNRVAHVFLGLAIAIVFPAFVFYAAVTFIPNAKTVAYPSYPNVEAPSPPSCSYTSSLNNSFSAQQRATCEAAQADYDRRLAAYDSAQEHYRQQVQAYSASENANRKSNEQHNFYRAILAVSLALVGIVALAAMASVPTLVYGMASGAGLTLLVGIGVILSSAPDDQQRLAGGILLALFGICAGMMLWYERSRPAIPVLGDSGLAPHDVPPVVPTPTAPVAPEPPTVPPAVAAGPTPETPDQTPGNEH